MMGWKQNNIFILSLLQPITAVCRRPPPPTDGDLVRVLPGPCWVAHSRCPLIKLQPCSLLSCWQTKVLKRTPSVIASNLGPNVLFHVNVSQRKGSRCSRLASTFTLSNTVQQTSAWIFFFLFDFFILRKWRDFSTVTQGSSFCDIRYICMSATDLIECCFFVIEDFDSRAEE